MGSLPESTVLLRTEAFRENHSGRSHLFSEASKPKIIETFLISCLKFILRGKKLKNSEKVFLDQGFVCYILGSERKHTL